MVSRQPAGNSAVCVLASTPSPPGIADPVELVYECAVTMEIQWLARKDARPATSLSNEERDGRSLEVGGTHSSAELW